MVAQRRLGAMRAALVAGGGAEAATLLEVASEIAQTAGLSLSDEDGEWGEIYKEIGVTPVINATGSVTILGGSTPHPAAVGGVPWWGQERSPVTVAKDTSGRLLCTLCFVPLNLLLFYL